MKKCVWFRIHIWLMVLLIMGVGCQQKEYQEQSNQSNNGIDVEERIRELGIQLYTPEPPIANYVRAVQSGDLVFLAGHGPRKPEGGYITGKVGKDIDIEQAKEAARLTAISLLSSLKAEIGDLNRVKRIVRVFGMVNCDESFTEQPQVINGCSDLLVEIFGESGKHARAAVGMISLPINISVEIEMIVELKRD